MFECFIGSDLEVFELSCLPHANGSSATKGRQRMSGLDLGGLRPVCSGPLEEELARKKL